MRRNLTTPNPSLSKLCVFPHQTVRETIATIDSNGKGIALVVESDRLLKATLTDGDIRRAILGGTTLDCAVSALLGSHARPYPITATNRLDAPGLIERMRRHSIRHLPIVDCDGRLEDLVSLEDLGPAPTSGLRAMIMAGGLGTRLRPLTEDTPKPMLPIGGRPLLEIILNQLRGAGIGQAHISTFYKPEKIKTYFGDGSSFGLQLEYVDEKEPLGTAGALRLVEEWPDPLLVLNGDILTRLNYKEMLSFHHEHRAAMTLAVREYETQIPYGVVEQDGASVRAIREKPRQSYFVNAGVYLVGRKARPHIPENGRFDMTDLINTLLKAGEPVVSFPVHEYWLDIGQHSDYSRAQVEVSQLLCA